MNICRQVINPLQTGNWKRVFTVILIVQLSLYISAVSACEPLVEEFCVDFYRGINLDVKPSIRGKVVKIKYDWGLHRPNRRVPRNNFSALWRGKFEFKKGVYEFRVHADKGIRLLIDGQPVIDHWEDGAGVAYNAQIKLDAAVHLIEVEYSHGTGEAYVEASWKSVSTFVSIPKNNKAPLGINLSYFSYSSSAVPFKDLMAQSGLREVVIKGSKQPCPKQPEMSDTGFPLSLPKGCIFQFSSAFHILNDKFWPKGTQPYQSGRYVLLYQGKGKINLGWDAKNAVQTGDGRIDFDVPSPKAGLQIKIEKIDAYDPIRNIEIVHVNDEASFRNQPFNETWLDLLKPFSLIRFSAWGKVSEKIKVYSGSSLSHTSKSITLPSLAPDKTGVFDNRVAVVNVNGKWPRVMIDHYDGKTKTLTLKTPIETSKSSIQPTIYIYDFLNMTWSERTPPTTSKQGVLAGVAFETMIKLANTLDINPWISVPTAADDDFVEQLALLIKTQLKPHLKCYIEYSNETWNSGFPGYHYAEAKAKELQLKGGARQADAWQAYRAVEIFRIFNRVFDEQDLRENRVESRLVRILTSQTIWLARALKVMDWEMPNNAWPTQGEPAHKYADAWAITTYFDFKSKETLEYAGMEELFSQQIDSIDTLFGNADSPGIIRNILAEVNRRSLQLVAYEGGTHLLAPHNKPNLVAKLAEINKNRRMTEVYKHLLTQWNLLYQEFGGKNIGIWNHYSDVSRYSKHGYWGLMQSTYQVPLTAPKYMAIKEYSLDSQ